MGMTERLRGTAGRITATNPFDGTEVGAVADMPPENAPAILHIASEGARTCRALSRHERARVARRLRRAGGAGQGGVRRTDRRQGRQDDSAGRQGGASLREHAAAFRRRGAAQYGRGIALRFESLALGLANAPTYRLHAGIFTSDLQAAQALEARAVMINDSSDYRLDAMPFGGFKYGSLGREAVRFAFEEMTQPKVVCIRRAA